VGKASFGGVLEDSVVRAILNMKQNRYVVLQKEKTPAFLEMLKGGVRSLVHGSTSNFTGRELGGCSGRHLQHDGESRATFALVGFIFFSELWSVRSLVLQVRTSHYSKNEPKISDCVPYVIDGTH